MKVSDLKKLLADCEDDASVDLIIPASIIDGETNEHNEHIEIAYDPKITIGSDTQGRVMWLNIELPDSRG